MATILRRIKRAVRDGNYEIGFHCVKEIAADNLTIREVVSAIHNAQEFDKITDEESHTRYRVFGVSSTGRQIVIVAFFSHGTLHLKTVYEAIY